MSNPKSHSAPLATPYPLAGGVDDVLAFLSAHGSDESLTLLAPSGESVALPASMIDALGDVAREASRGYEVTVIAHDKLISTQDAADILGVSRPHLVKLLESGDMPFHLAGTHRRVRLEDVLAYKAERDGVRRESLRKLTEESQLMGLIK